jgi:hypothetical protein
VFFCHAEHAAAAAGRIVQSPNDALSPPNLTVRREQQVNHELDDLARSEVVTAHGSGAYAEYVVAKDRKRRSNQSRRLNEAKFAG